jgi:hypothetical protein
MQAYLPATMALWLAFNLFVVLLMGVVSKRLRGAD